MIFVGYLPGNQELYTALQEYGYLLKFKPVLPAKDGKRQKGDVDADMVLNIMKYYEEYNQVVIVTSDGDFDTTVKYLKKRKKLCVVLSPNKEKCSHLLEAAAQDRIDYLENLKEKLKLRRSK